MARQRALWLKRTVAAALALAAIPGAIAEQIGGDVPALNVPIVNPLATRDNGLMAVTPSRGAMQQQRDGEITKRFGTALRSHGRPRFAIYWNRQLADHISDWYGVERLVINERTGQQAGSTTTIEDQIRISGGGQRAGHAETWEWEFQDGFIGPFRQAGAAVIDRGTIMRMTAAQGQSADIEATALLGRADYLIEVLDTPSTATTVGYELRARVIKVASGEIVGMVNSRSMASWQYSGPRYQGSNRGYIRVDDDNNPQIGPQPTEVRWRASSSGYTREARPPKLRAIAANLAVSVMNTLLQHWGQ